MNQAKSELRAKLKQTRMALSDEERQQASAIIVKKLQQVANWSAIKTIHCYEPIADLKEVDISDFVAYIRQSYPDLELYTSRRIGKNWQIVHLPGGELATDIKFDAIIVPMLGFDAKTLHRIGYGGGYYDKFLATQPRATKIGVCFEQGRLDQIPTEPHDIPLDMIITEQNT